MTNQTKEIVTNLLGAEIANTIEIEDVYFRASYNYWNENGSAEVCSNIVVNAKMIKNEFYIIFYHGIGKKSGECKNKVYLISERWRKHMGLTIESMLSPDMYSFSQAFGEELSKIRYQIDVRFFMDEKGLLNDNPLLFEEYANELEREEYIIINKKISKQNPSRKDYEDLQEKLEEIKELLDEKTARDNFSIVVNSALTPLSVKQFLYDNEITAIDCSVEVMSPDYMPTEGCVVKLISKNKDFSPLVFEIDEGFFDMYGEGCATAEDLFKFDKIKLSTARELFSLFIDSFNKNGEFQAKKITMQQLEKDENVLKNIYSTCSEVCEGEFADYLCDNMDEIFEQPHNVALITKAIQDFRSWGAAEDENEIFAEINYVQDVEITDIKWDSDGEKLSNSLDINIPMRIFENEDPKDYDQIASDYMSDLISDHSGFLHKGFSDTFDKNMYFINEFHDYMYADNTFVEVGTRVGIIKNEKLVLDKGIFYANTPRNIFLSKEKTEECSNCKKSIAPEDETYTNFSNGKTLCDSCSVMCESCGNYFHEDGGNRDGENIFCCHGCLQGNQDTLRLIQLEDDERAILLANTNLTSDEISKAVSDESDSTMDYEEKLDAYAKANSKVFERVYAELELV